MARTIQRLTAIAVGTRKKSGLYPDGDGLYLRVTESGSKSWIFRYRTNGKLRDMGLGALTSVGLARARELAAECRRIRAEGRDPIEARKARITRERLAAQGAQSFRECAEALIASHEPGWRNAKHRQQWRNTFKTYVFPLIGDVAVGDVGTDHVLLVLQQPVTTTAGKMAPFWNEKPETASRVRGRIENVLAWAKARRLRAGENPALWRGHLDQLLPARAKVRRVVHHPALPYGELPGFVAELRAKDNSIAALALEFTILTAARTSEALGATFDEIDLDAKLWIVSPERMKAGREHRVPLCARTVAIVKEAAAMRQSEFVFPGLKKGKPLSNMALLMLLREMRPGLTVHGFRSTFRDWAAETTSYPNHVVEMALAHTVGDKVEAAYRRGDLFEKRRKLMDAWGTFCGRKPTGAEVVPLRRRMI